MMRLLLKTLAIAIAVSRHYCCPAAPATPPAPKLGAFVHPGITQNRAELDFMKQKVLAGEQPWKGAWERLLAADYSSLNFNPRPFAHVIRGPYGNPRIGADELQASANAAYSHALQWYITGEKAHAQKVIEIFNAWSPVLQDFQQNDAKLLAGWTGYDFCDAAEILRVTDSGWSEADIAQFKKMLLGVYYPLLKDFFPEANGNWDAAIMSTLMAMGIFCDDRVMFDRAVDHFIRGPLNGGITHYVYPSGQCQESTRDYSHTQLGLGWMARAARVAWTQGIDLFGAADNRLALGFEHAAKYLLGEEVPTENTISRRERLQDIYLPVYQHYHFDQGMDLPFISQAAGKTIDRASLSLLTMFRGPGKSAGASSASASQEKHDAPKPSPIAAAGGALREPTATPPPNAMRVAPNESIQTALDARKGQGGWVVLGKGLHTLPAPLRIPSGVTLAGEGAGTVLWMTAKATGPAILNADDDLHDVTLRDFVLEGATSSNLPTDPNSARRARSRPNAPSRGGIQFVAGQVTLGAPASLPASSESRPSAGRDAGAPSVGHVARAHMLSNLRLEHITIRHCTETGLAIENARQIVLTGCSFTDNGSSLAPNSKPYGNVLLIRVHGCEITDTRLNNSPAGDGLYLLASREVILAGNEIARNALQGLHARDSEALQVRNNLFEGNEAGGLLLDPESNGCRGITVLNNLVRNSGGYGIDIQRANGGTLGANRLSDNARGDEVHWVSCENLGR